MEAARGEALPRAATPVLSHVVERQLAQKTDLEARLILSHDHRRLQRHFAQHLGLEG